MQKLVRIKDPILVRVMKGERIVKEVETPDFGDVLVIRHGAETRVHTTVKEKVE